MPREKEAYRDNLEALKAFLDNKYGDERHLMTVKDICEYTGRSFDFVKKVFWHQKNRCHNRKLCKNAELKIYFSQADTSRSVNPINFFTVHTVSPI